MTLSTPRAGVTAQPHVSPWERPSGGPDISHWQ